MKVLGYSICEGKTGNYVRMTDDKSSDYQLVSDRDERTVFFNENDAENIMEMLNDETDGAFFIVDEYEKDTHVKWNVEDGALLHPHLFIGNEPIFSLETEVTRDAKIEFLDKMKNGMMTYMLNLIKAYQNEAPSLPKDNYGEVKTVSLKAWLKRNDSAKAVDDHYRYGQMSFMGCNRYISDAEHKAPYDHYDNYVDECFHRLCKELQRQEEKWFVEHDEAHILESQISEMSEHFGALAPLIYSSSKGILLGSLEENRKMTIPEMQELLDKYAELEAKFNELRASVSFDYEHPKEEKPQKKAKGVEYGD